LPGTLAASASQSLVLTSYVESTGPYNTSTEILSSDTSDNDSVPGNGSTTEDDDLTLALNPIASLVTPISCPGAPSILDWDTQTWSDGDLTNSYTIDGEPITVSIADPFGAMVNHVLSGETSPSYTNTLGGGYNPFQQTITVFMDQPNRTNFVTYTFDLGTPGTGVDKFQTTLFDLDFGVDQFVRYSCR